MTLEQWAKLYRNETAAPKRIALIGYAEARDHWIREAAQLVGIRASAMRGHVKSISHFDQLRGIEWDEIILVGEPTDHFEKMWLEAQRFLKR